MPNCRYTSPRTIDEALRDLEAAAGDAHVIAGGIALGILMNEKLVEPIWLIDISRIEALGGIEHLPDGSLRIGALATHAEVERSEAVARNYPILREMAREIACGRIRNRGTVGGNLCLADPQGDPPAAAIALRAVLRAAARQGPRDIPATHFFTDLYTTALGEDELLQEVIVPPPPENSAAVFGKFAARRAMDYTSTVSVAVQLVRDPDDGCIAEIGLGLGGVGAVPVWPQATEAVLAGRVPEPDTFGEMRRSPVRRARPDRGSHVFRRLQAPRGVGRHEADGRSPGPPLRGRRADEHRDRGGAVHHEAGALPGVRGPRLRGGEPMSIEIAIEVNGAAHRLGVEPTETLLDLLRERLGLTGTNKDCCMGICGACTVLFNRRPVSSCLLLAGQADGGAVTTVEGLECNGALSPLQEAFLKHGATQCGYCTPGFLMTATALLEENPSPTRADIMEALKGNLCRCTGYKKIIEAVESVAERRLAGPEHRNAHAPSRDHSGA